MKTLVFILSMLCGCSTAHESVEEHEPELTRLGVSRFQTEKPPTGSEGGRPEKYYWLNFDQRTLYIGFTDSDNNWASPKWTNDWDFTALVSTDLRAWNEVHPELHAHNGQLVFTIISASPALFVTGKFTQKIQ